MRQRFAHLLVSESDSDSSSPKNTGPNVADAFNNMQVETKVPSCAPSIVNEKEEVGLAGRSNINAVQVQESSDHDSVPQVPSLVGGKGSANASVALSCGSSTGRLPERKEPSRRTSRGGVALSDKTNTPHESLNGPPKTPLSKTNGLSKTSPGPSYLQDTAVGGGDAKTHTDMSKNEAPSQLDSQDGKEIPGESMKAQASVVGGKVAEAESVGKQKVQPLLTDATATETKATHHPLLLEKYWEKCYGFDPYKRRMPLFVTVEHCPPTKALAKTELPKPHPSQRNSETETSLVSQMRMEFTHPVEDVTHVVEELEAPPKATDFVVSNSGSLENSLNTTLFAQYAKNSQKEKSLLEGGSERRSIVSGSLESTQRALEMDLTHADSTKNNTEEKKGRRKKIPLVAGKGVDASLSTNITEMTFPSDRNSLKSPKEVEANQGSETASNEESSGNIGKGDVNMSVLQSKSISKEPPAQNISVSSPCSKTETSSRSGSLRQEHELQSMLWKVTHSVKGEEPSVSKLTEYHLKSSARDGHEEKNGKKVPYDMGDDESSTSRKCAVPKDADKRSLHTVLDSPRHFMDPYNNPQFFERRKEPIMGPFHRRLLLDMEDMKRRDRMEMERSINEYTFKPNIGKGNHKRLPHRRQQHNAEETTASPADCSGHIPGYRMPVRKPLPMEPLLSFKPVISKFAQEMVHTTVPYHERLYTPKVASPQANTADGINGSSPRLMELISSADLPLFHPDISPMAKAIENGSPFHKRLYPKKEELERRRMDDSPPSFSPRRSPRRSLPISSRLLERSSPPPDKHPFSFHPVISPRAMSIENNLPFHKRLYPDMEELEIKMQAEQHPNRFLDLLSQFHPRGTQRDDDAYINVEDQLAEQSASSWFSVDA